MKPNVLYFDQANDEMVIWIRRSANDKFNIFFYQNLTPQEKETAIQDAHYFIVAAEKISGEMIRKSRNLKLIHKTGAGVDNIDIEVAQSQGVRICNTPGSNASAVAELTILHILALYRKYATLNTECKQGKWPMWDYRLQSRELRGKIHGIVGFGEIGQAVARLSCAFGARILYNDITRYSIEVESQTGADYVPIEELMSQADIISLHIPLTDSTKHFINERLLAMMKPSGILVNMARGGVLDESALAQSLASNTIAGAAFDTLEGEPFIADHHLLKFDQVSISPHVGAGTLETMSRVFEIVFSNIVAVENGQTPKYEISLIRR